MKKNEASVIIGNIPVNGKDGCYSITEYQEAKTVAVQALEEIQQYRAIGTPEECRAAVEKQKPKKPVMDGYCCFESYEWRALQNIALKFQQIEEMNLHI